MKRSSTTRRGKALASTTAAVGLMISGLALSSGPAQSAPAADCATPVDVSTLTEGDTLTALSVVKGTTPQEFTGTVVGVIDDGIAVGLDMLVVDFEDADPASAMARAGGIWQGMSGSPVYVGDPADGDLVGAIAYGLSWGPSPIAGITPFSEMDDYLDTTAPRTVRVDGTEARAIARESGSTRAQVEEGFSQLRLPVGVSGITGKRLQEAREAATERKARYFRGGELSAVRGGRDSAGRADADDLVAGGNMGASFSYGDITYAGVGTVTSVCGGEVVGFGHPMGFLGDTTLGLHPADALFVQPESLGAPFKVANISPAVGTVTDDRLAGITGTFGALPEAMTVTSAVAYRDRSRTGSSDAYVPEWGAEVTFSQFVANHDRVIDGITGGTEALDMVVEGTDEAGDPFRIDTSDLFVSDYDISFTPVWDVADLVWALGQFPDASIDSVDLDSTVTDETGTLRVTGVEQKRRGEWVKVSNRRGGVVAQAGRTLRVRAVLSAADDTISHVPFSTPIAGRARSGYLSVSGGAWAWTNLYRTKSVAEVVEAVESAPRNDDVAFELRLKRNGGRVEEHVGPQSTVVEGQKGLYVRVKGSNGARECRGC